MCDLNPYGDKNVKIYCYITTGNTECSAFVKKKIILSLNILCRVIILVKNNNFYTSAHDMVLLRIIIYT